MKDFPLHRAIREKNLELIHTLITEGVNVNEKEEDTGSSPLYVAVQSGVEEIVKLLLASRVLIYSDDQHFQNIVKLSVRSANKNILKLLLDAGGKAFIKGRGHCNDTLLHHAAEHGNSDILNFLLEHGAKASINQRNSRNHTPLVTFLERYWNKSRSSKVDVETAKILLDAGANPNDAYNGSYILLKAIDDNDERLVKVLIDAKVNVNTSQCNPLTEAILKNKKREITEMLVDAGANVNYKSNKGTALQLASQRNDVALIKYLISRGANYTETECSADTINLQLILDQLTNMNEKIDREKKVEVERWNSLEKKIEKIERKICLLDHSYKESQERKVENKILDELQGKIEEMRVSVNVGKDQDNVEEE